MKLSLLIILLALTGCIRSVEKSSFRLQVSDHQNDRLNQLCEEMRQISSLQEHFRLLELAADEFIDLMEGYRHPEDYSIVVNINERVEFHAARIKELIHNDFLVEKFDYEVEWIVDKKDFRNFLGHYLPRGLEIESVEKVGAVYFGEERHDLLESLEVSFEAKGFTALYRSNGSALEICQLQNTRMLFLQVNYRHLLHRQSRTFNLIYR